MNPRSKDSRNKPKSYALKLLNYRPRSKKEMLDRLSQKGFNEDQINNTLKFLENAGLMNDELLSRELLRSAAERKLLGRKGIEMFLLKRGIERELISKTITGYSREMEKKAASKLVEKKLKILKHYSKNIVNRRLCGMLRRRGFSADIIYKAISSIDKKT